MNNKRIHIIAKLKENPSYLKWGVPRLAVKFSCSKQLMKDIITGLQDFKQEYIKNIVKIED